MTRHRTRARWLAPVAATATIVGSVWLSSAADADEPLPARTAAQLLVDLQSAKPTALSGTIAYRADLGLPQLPASMTGGANTGSAASLLSGEHTLRVWSDGAKRSRLALLADSSETNIVRDGDQLWQWSSATQTATHSVLTGREARPNSEPAHPSADPSEAPVPRTPAEAADWALGKLEPTTAVSAAGTATVAGRSAYELVLTPKQTATKVGSVRLAIDAVNHVPLRVQVFPARSVAPAIEVGFSSVDFHTPSASVFRFTPPKGAKIVQAEEKTAQPDRKSAAAAATQPTHTGTGWAEITAGKLPPKPAGKAQARDSSADQLADQMAELFPKQSGAWGTGRVWDGTLVSVVVTDDGRYAVGAVEPSALYSALPAK